MKSLFILPIIVVLSILGASLSASTYLREATPDLSFYNDKNFLGAHNEGRLVPVKTRASAEKFLVPLILIHGQSGGATNFAKLIPAVRKLAQYKLLYFAHEDLHRPLKVTSADLANAILKLRSPRVTIVAHDTGGLLAREALNILARSYKPEALPHVQVIAMNSPWQGESQYSCSVKERILPAAVADMRDCSDFFKGLFATSWPRNFSMTLLFAKEGNQALEYFEGALKDVPQKIADYISYGKPVSGSLAETNYWKALRSSSQYFNLEIGLNSLQTEKPLSADQVRAELENYFPHLPGGNVTVLSPSLWRQIDFPRYLDQIL